MKKMKKAFTLVELCVVIAIVAVLATVSIVGYNSFIKKERINNTITEATQAREVIISQLMSDSDGIVKVLTVQFSYENGQLLITDKGDVLPTIEQFNEELRKQFPAISNLPGVFIYDGADIYYHYDANYTGEDYVSEFDCVVNIVSGDYYTTNDKTGSIDGSILDKVKIKLDQFSITLKIDEEGSIGYEYSVNGSYKSAEWKSTNTKIATVTSKVNVKDTPKGSVTIKGKSSGHTSIRLIITLDDGSTIGKSIDVTVAPEGKTIIKVPYQKNRLIYTTDASGVAIEQYPEWNKEYDTYKDVLEIKSTSVLKATNVGYYLVYFDIKEEYKDTYCWAEDFSNDTKGVYWRINKRTVNIPSQSNYLAYEDGYAYYESTLGRLLHNTILNSYVPSWNDYAGDADKNLTLKTEIEGHTIPGSYPVVFALKDSSNYIFEDGTEGQVTVYWTVYPKKLKKPTVANLVYTGSGQLTNIVIDGLTRNEVDVYIYNYLNCGGDNEKEYTYVGHYYTTFSIDIDSGKMNNGEKALENRGMTLEDCYMWEDGTKDPYTVEWQITKRDVVNTSTTPSTLEFIYDGSAHKLDINLGSDGDYLEIETRTMDGTPVDNDNIITAGTYKTIVKLKDAVNTKWAQGSSQSEYTWSIKRITITDADLPKQSNTLIYNAAEQSPTFTSNQWVQKTEFTAQTKAGKYPVTFTSNENCVFSNGTRYITVNEGWEIKKKTNIPVPTLSNNEKTYTGSEISIGISYDNKFVKIGSGSTQKRTNVGSYTTTYELVSPSSSTWSDGTTEAKVVSWKIVPKKVAIPSLSTTSFTYNGKEQSPTVTNTTDSSWYNTTGASATSAGSYTVTWALKDAANTTWSDGTTANKTANWTINKKSVAIPSLSTTSLTYNGKEQSPTVTNTTDSSLYTTTGDKGTKAQSYTITWTLKDTTNSAWSDGTTAAKSANWKITKTSVARPTVKSNLEFLYTGSVISPFTSSTIDSKITVGGSGVSQTAVGNYTTTLSIDPDSCEWSDGYEYTSYSINWSISKNKINGTPSASSLSLTYNGSNQKPAWNTLDGVVITGTTEAKDVGSYTTTFTPDSNHCWSDNTETPKSINWTINTKKVAIPTVSGNYTYNGSNQSASIGNTTDSSFYTQSGTTSSKAVGTYTVTFTLKDTKNSTWSDGTTAAKSGTWKINKISVTIPTLQSNTFTFEYTASRNLWGKSRSKTTHTITVNNMNTTYITQTGDTSKTDAGSYTVTWTLKDTTNTAWSDGTTAAKSATWTIEKRKLTKPTLSQSSFDRKTGYGYYKIVDYTNNYDDVYMDIGGTTEKQKKSSGSYTVTYDLVDKANTTWADGSTSKVSLNWSIK